MAASTRKQETTPRYKPPLDCEVDHDAQGVQIILCGNLDVNGRAARVKAIYEGSGNMRAYCGQCEYGFLYFDLNNYGWRCEMCARILSTPNPRRILARFVYDASIPAVVAASGRVPNAVAPEAVPVPRAPGQFQARFGGAGQPIIVDNNPNPPHLEWNVGWRGIIGEQPAEVPHADENRAQHGLAIEPAEEFAAWGDEAPEDLDL